MSNKAINKLLSKILLLFSPLIVIVSCYFIFDPFKVLYDYDEYYTFNKGKIHLQYNVLNINKQMFESNYKQYKYNSFIFANSRGLYFDAYEWQKYLLDSSIAFHFAFPGAGLFAIEKSIKYLDEKNSDLKNSLLLLDNNLLEQVKKPDGHMFSIPHAIGGKEYFIPFHTASFKAYMHPLFLIAIADKLLTGKHKKYMNQFFYDELPFYKMVKYEKKYNQFNINALDKQLNNDSFYASELKSVFYIRGSEQVFGDTIIRKEQKLLLESIYSVYKKHHTNYKIVINPLYNQIKLNKADLKYIQKLFGAENVYDFSGINQMTADYTNYYETSHYRPCLANEIMNIVYTTKPSNN